MTVLKINEILGREITDCEIIGYDIGNGEKFEIKANIDGGLVWFGLVVKNMIMFILMKKLQI